MAKYKVGDKVSIKTSEGFEEIGEILYIDKCDCVFPYLLGIKGFRGHNGNKGSSLESLVKTRGYANQCWWVKRSEILGVWISTGNEVIDLLMKKLGVDVDEEFEVKGSSFNPFHFNKQGKLVDCDFDERQNVLFEMIYEEREIKNIHKTEVKEMTMEQLQEALGHPVKIVKGGE